MAHDFLPDLATLLCILGNKKTSGVDYARLSTECRDYRAALEAARRNMGNYTVRVVPMFSSSYFLPSIFAARFRRYSQILQSGYFRARLASHTAREI